MSKTQLPYLIQEALEIGGWNAVSLNANNEKYQRGNATVEIGTRPLLGTSPASYVFRLALGDHQINKSEKLPDLCRRLAQK